MSKVMVAMLLCCCGSKDVSQMGGAIIVRGEGKDNERESQVAWFRVCVQAFTSGDSLF